MPARRRPAPLSLNKGAKQAEDHRGQKPSSDESEGSVGGGCPSPFSSVESLSESASEDRDDQELANEAPAPGETDEALPHDSPKIKLQTSDGVILEVPIAVLNVSATIRDILRSLPLGAEGEVVPLPKVHSGVLAKVLEWARHHWKDKEPETPEQRAERNRWMGPTIAVKFYDVVSEWDERFLSVDEPTLVAIMYAANYLNIKALLDTACTFVAHHIRGRSPAEMRKILNITSDFTPAEEARLRIENAYCEM